MILLRDFSGKGNLEKIKRLNDIPVNPLFDSELEQRFVEAIRNKAGSANVTDTVRNGKHSYYVKFENTTWEIEPQVTLDTEYNVAVKCKPDFVFWPISAPGHKPVAVFTDGYEYHKDIASDDTIKREAIRRSGGFRVWSLSYKDVQNEFIPQGDYISATLEAERMPYGMAMYQGSIKSAGADVIIPSKMSSFELLVAYLNMPNAEDVFKAHANAYSLSLLEPKWLTNNQAFNQWKTIIDAVKDQTNPVADDFVFKKTMYGSWSPRTSSSHLTIHAGISTDILKNKGEVSVYAILNDEKDKRTDKYSAEWNGFWQFSNIMQFNKEFVAVSSVGITNMDYLKLPIANITTDTVNDTSSEWDAIFELLFDDEAKQFAKIAKDANIPAPDEDHIGYELEGASGDVLATVEIMWPDKKIVFLTTEQSEDRDKLEAEGWKVITMLEVTDLEDMFGGAK